MTVRIGYLMQAGVPDLRGQPYSGPSVHVTQVVGELRQRGHIVRLVVNLGDGIWTSDDTDDYRRVSASPLDAGALRLFERAVRRAQSRLRLPYAAIFDSLQFAHACCRELRGFDLFYERMGWMGYGGGLAARWLGVPLILEVNGDHLSELALRGIPPRGVQRWLSVTLMRRAVRVASQVVATGEGWRTRFIRTWQVDPERVHVVQNGSRLVGIVDRRQLRSFQTHPALGKITTIAYSGSFDPWQGVPILVRAIAKAAGDGVALRLLLIGSGPGVEGIERLVRELRLEKRVAFTGQLALQQYADCLTEADIGVAPYCGRVEYSGLKLIDYKAAGLAIIASGQDGEPRIVEHGRTGWIVPPCNEDALHEAIMRMCFDVELRRRMGRRARIEAEQLHDWSKTAERLDQLFARVVTQ